MRGATRTWRRAVGRHRSLVTVMALVLLANGVGVAQAGEEAGTSGPPTFGQPTISGIGGIGFSNGLAVDGNGVVYTHVPDTMTSKTSWLWRSTDNARTFKLVPGSTPLVGAVHPCLGGSDIDVAVDGANNLYIADLIGPQGITTARSTDGGKTVECQNASVPDSPVDRPWLAIDGIPLNGDGSGTGAGTNAYLFASQVFRNVDCPNADLPNVLAMYRSPAPVGFGEGGGAGSGGLGFGPGQRITALGAEGCGGGPGNAEVSPVATATGKLVDGVKTKLPTPVKHVYAIHDDITGHKVQMARCFPVDFHVVPIPNVQDPTGLNCDDLTVADLGPSHKTGARWTSMAIDTRGNLYAVWPQAPVDAAGMVTGDTVVKYAFSKDEGATWSTPVTVPVNASVGRLHENVFAYVRAGDPGRVNVSWIGTPGRPVYPSNGPDSCPDGSTAVTAPARVCDWYVFMSQTLNGLNARPTFIAPIQASDHFMHRGSMHTFIGQGFGDRTLGDYFQMEIGRQGEAYLSYADSNLRTHIAGPGTSTSHAMVVRQNGGPGLYASKQPQGDPILTGAASDPASDARYEAGGVVSPSAPNLDITASSITRPATTDCRPRVPCLRVSMSIRNLGLAAGAPAGDADTNLVWLTQWLSPSAKDPRGGKNFFVFAQSTAGGELQCFSGDNGYQVNFASVGQTEPGGYMLTYPGRKAITARGACSIFPGANGRITIDVPISDVTVADPINRRLYSVTASTMTTPDAAHCLCDTDSMVGQLFNVIDVGRAYGFRYG